MEKLTNNTQRLIRILCANAVLTILLLAAPNNHGQVAPPPSVTITDPIDGASFTAGQNVPITVDAFSEAGIARVEFFADSRKIGTSTTEPFSFTWMAPEDGRYDLRARAYDTAGNSGDSPIVKIVVGTKLAPYVLFIAKLDSPANIAASDAKAVSHLQSLGLDVQVVDDDLVDASLADDKQLIVNSSSVTSGLVGATFFAAPVPFLNWEGGVQDDMQMSIDMAGDVNGQTDLNIVKPEHPMAAGLTGTITVVNGGPDNWTAGNPNENGEIIATLASNPERGCIYVYEPGDPLVDGTPAPAGRMHIFFRDTTFSVLNERGLALFEAAVFYGLGATPPTVSITAPTAGQAFAVGANVSITATATAGSNAVERVYFYVDGEKIGEDSTAPYTGTWMNAAQGSHTISVIAKDAIGLERRSEVTVNVGDVTPPTVVITSPANNAVLASGANVAITVNAGDAVRVEFFADDQLIGESTTAPFNFTFTAPPDGEYILRARGYDALGNAGDSAPVTIVVGAERPNVLLIVANPTGGGAGDLSDQAVRDHLATHFGFDVQVVDDNVVQTSHATGKQLIICSSTVSSGNVGNKFLNTAVPLLNWEAGLQDDMAMVSAAAQGFDRPGQIDLEIVDPAHPLAAGLAAGIHTVVDNAVGFTAGRPNANAKVVATITGVLDEACIYIYEPGALLENGSPAPSARIHFFFQDVAFANVNDTGRALFNAAVQYAITFAVTPPEIGISSPANNSAFTLGADVPITVTTENVVRVEFFANDALIGQSTTAPFNFTFTPSANGSYILRARGFDAQGIPADSAPVTVVIGPPRPAVLFVVANPTGSGNGDRSDQAVRDHLVSHFGFDVQVVDDNAVQTSDAAGKKLIIVSSTVSSGNVAAKFLNTAVPFLNWEAGVQDDMAMVPSGQGFDRPTQTVLDIVNATHPLAAGLSAGLHTVVSTAVGFTAGRPNANAQVVATIEGNAAEACIYVYEPGALLENGSPAPARRIHIFFQDIAFVNLTDEGRALFNAAVEYATAATSLGRLDIQDVADKVRITWSGPGRLQEATNILGPWALVTPTGANQHETETSGTMRFFRLIE